MASFSGDPDCLLPPHGVAFEQASLSAVVTTGNLLQVASFLEGL